MFPFGRFRIADASMEPSLQAGDYVLAYRWAYRRARPRPGDVVVLRDPVEPSRLLVKRVSVTGPDDRVVVLGDNRESSRDSRHFGPVDVGAIVGRVVLRTRA